MEIVPSIGIWGPTRSGKTTYLAGLKMAIDKYAKKWRIWPVNNEAKIFFETNHADLVHGILPTSTEVTAPTAYEFEFYRPDSFMGSNGRYHRVTIFDAAGGHITDPSDKYGFFARLAQCRGLLLMVDPEDLHSEQGQPGPFDSTETYYRLLLRLAMRLGETLKTKRGTLNINFAFCLSKMDQDRHWKYHLDPGTYMRHILGETAMDGILSYCEPSQTRFFSISVAGRYKVNGFERPNITSSGGQECIADIRQWQPYQLLDPLFWLFDQLEEEQNARLPFWQRQLRALIREKNYQG